MQSKQNLIALRKAQFQQRLLLNHQLIEIVKHTDSHAFLTNPAAHNVYLYLTNYVRVCSEAWLKTKLTTLRVLDWGCGKGHISFLLREMGAMVTSCDVTSGAAFGQDAPIIDRASISVVSLEHPYLLPFNDASFDVVLSFGVLEHVSNDLASLHEIRRVLSPQGLFFCFFLPYYLSWTQRLAHLRGDFYHDRLYSKKLVKHLLTQSQFQLIDLWHRQILPKNRISYVNHHSFESLDRWLTENTFLKYIATNIEFVAFKN